ncbi:MAG: winged helix-turn-helix transcriptional regulator [Anaerolineales bacterium]|nr:winged helix-turn-helix transcriptional regulator [Anaerolineales bacterium]
MMDNDLTALLMDWLKTSLMLALHDITRLTRRTGLTLAQMNVLLHLYYSGPRDVSHLCETMQISPPGTSQMIERMVQLGVVERKEFPGDRRVRMVDLTELGQRIILESLSMHRAWVEQLFSELSPEDRECLVSTLPRLIESAAKVDIRPS